MLIADNLRKSHQRPNPHCKYYFVYNHVDEILPHINAHYLWEVIGEVDEERIPQGIRTQVEKNGYTWVRKISVAGTELRKGLVNWK